MSKYPKSILTKKQQYYAWLGYWITKFKVLDDIEKAIKERNKQ